MHLNTMVEQRAVSGPVECPWLLGHHTHGGGAHGPIQSQQVTAPPPQARKCQACCFPARVISSELKKAVFLPPPLPPFLLFLLPSYYLSTSLYHTKGSCFRSNCVLPKTLPECNGHSECISWKVLHQLVSLSKDTQRTPSSSPHPRREDPARRCPLLPGSRSLPESACAGPGPQTFRVHMLEECRCQTVTFCELPVWAKTEHPAHSSFSLSHRVPPCQLDRNEEFGSQAQVLIWTWRPLLAKLRVHSCFTWESLTLDSQQPCEKAQHLVTGLPMYSPEHWTEGGTITSWSSARGIRALWLGNPLLC